MDAEWREVGPREEEVAERKPFRSDRRCDKLGLVRWHDFVSSPWKLTGPLSEDSPTRSPLFVHILPA